MLHLFDAARPENLAKLRVSNAVKGGFGEHFFITYDGGDFITEFPPLTNSFDVSVMTSMKKNGKEEPVKPACSITKNLAYPPGDEDSLEARTIHATEIIVDHLVGLLKQTEWMNKNPKFKGDLFDEFFRHPIQRETDEDKIKQFGSDPYTRFKVEVDPETALPSEYVVWNKNKEPVHFTQMVRGSKSKEIVKWRDFFKNASNVIFLTRLAKKSWIRAMPVSIDALDFSSNPYDGDNYAEEETKQEVGAGPKRTRDETADPEPETDTIQYEDVDVDGDDDEGEAEFDDGQSTPKRVRA